MDSNQLIDDIATHGWCLWDDFLSPEEVDALRVSLPDHWQPAGIGRASGYQEDKAVRSDKIHWLAHGDSPGVDQYLDKMVALKDDINRSLFLGLFEYEAHFAKYNVGDFYAKHVDAFKGRSNRKLTSVVYLNHDWSEQDGGEIVLYNQDDSYLTTLWPKAGRLVTFLSEQFPHEVLAAKRQRYSIAGWFRVNGMTAGCVDPSF